MATRTLRLTVERSRTTWPILLVATLVPSAACGARTDLEASSSSSSGTGGQSGTGGAGGDPIVSSSSTGFTTSSTSSTGGGAACDPSETQVFFTVEVPPEGTPATPGQICSVMSPVESNFAARVTLSKSPGSLESATGFVAMDAALDGSVIGLPTIEVVDPAVPELGSMVASNIVAVAGGFSFDATWTASLANIQPESWTKLRVRVTFTLACDGGETRTVMSTTDIHLCIEDAMLAWVSSGDECQACEIIAEMAPSPIVPDGRRDDLPLAKAVRLRIVTLARVGDSWVLFAENDGGDGLDYAWRASGGTLTELAPDVVVWNPPADGAPHQLQVAVAGDDGAAVASFVPGAKS
ncbi:MAG TPA: hypothetical protein VL400_24570 [Polyangiaceae bacterium]|jgi:hypothetical protein|nr:hypothetical protein [Polyangiaceae bacterium]